MSGLLATVWEKASDTVAAYSLPELEVKVREATNSDNWGPTGPQMKELARATSYYQDMHTVMNAIWKRIGERDKNWRYAYKSLLLVDYILRNGAEQVIPECRRHSYDIQALMSFHHIDENDKDQGVNVRERAKHVFELLSDDSRLRDEREKAQKNTGKFETAISSDSYGGYGGYGGGGGGGYGGGGYGGNRSNDYPGSRSHSDNYGGRDVSSYEPRRAPATAARAPPTYVSDEEEEAPKPARVAAAAKPSAPKVVIAPISAAAPAPAPVPKTNAGNIFDMDFPAPVAAPASAPAPASTSFFPPSQQTSFFPTGPAAHAPPQEDFFNPRGGAAAAPTAKPPAGGDVFGDFVTAPVPPSAQTPTSPPPKDDDPWAHATLFKGLTNKPEPKAAAPAAPKATLGQLAKAAPSTVPTTPAFSTAPAYTAGTYNATPMMQPMGAPMMGTTVIMGSPMMGTGAYVPAAGGYVMTTAYTPGNPALR